MHDQEARLKRREIGLRIALGAGVLLTWTGLGTPWFGFNEIEDDGYRILGGHDLPAAGLLIALLAVLTLAPVLPGRLCHPGVLGVVAGVAVTLALASTLVVAFAFADALSPRYELEDITFGGGLPPLVVGLATTIVASAGWFAAQLQRR